jgi:hypothetical protein
MDATLIGEAILPGAKGQLAHSKDEWWPGTADFTGLLATMVLTKDVTKDMAPRTFHGASSGKRYAITGRKGSIFIFAVAGLQGGLANKTCEICYNISYRWTTTHYEKFYMKHYMFNEQHTIKPCLSPMIRDYMCPTFHPQLNFVMEVRESDNKFWRCPNKVCINHTNLVYPNSGNICGQCYTPRPEGTTMYSASEYKEKASMFRAEYESLKRQTSTVPNATADASAPVSGRTPSAAPTLTPIPREALTKERDRLHTLIQMTDSIFDQLVRSDANMHANEARSSHESTAADLPPVEDKAQTDGDNKKDE